MTPENGPLAGIALTGTILAAALALAAPAIRAAPGGDCEPETYRDWRRAMVQGCLAPAFVCENLTTERMLADPEVAESRRRAQARGIDGAGTVAEIVAGVRDGFGCEPEAGAAWAPGADRPGRAPGAGRAPPIPDDEIHRGLRAPRPAGRLPPGHPPIRFDEPGTVTL